MSEQPKTSRFAESDEWKVVGGNMPEEFGEDIEVGDRWIVEGKNATVVEVERDDDHDRPLRGVPSATGQVGAYRSLAWTCGHGLTAG